MNTGREKIARDSTFCFNDRVIQIRNNYTLEVFNGEMGLIDEYVERESRSVSNKVDKFVIVRFEDPGGDRLVEYPFADAESELRLAYALTIHKSQGSEFKAVFIPVHETNWIMLKRNLLYTGITRAKKYVVLVGTLKALNHAIKTVDSATRHTMLRERIFRETRLEV
jgi:exodeoxyribonuclease V alpha subunit